MEGILCLHYVAAKDGAQGGLTHFVRGVAPMLRIALLRFASSNLVLVPSTEHKKRPQLAVLFFFGAQGGTRTPTPRGT